MQWPRRVLSFQRLREEQQAVEALLLDAVEKTGPGAMAFALRHQPEMRDPCRQETTNTQIGQKQIIALATALWWQDIGTAVQPGKSVSRHHLHHVVARVAQSGGETPRHSGFISKKQPDLAGGISKPLDHIDFDLRRTWSPNRGPTPILDFICSGQMPRCPYILCLTWFDKVAAALERVGRQNHTLAVRLAPDLVPINRHTQRGQPAQHFKHMLVVGNLFVAVAQAGKHLVRRNIGMLPRQRAQCLARTDFQEHPVVSRQGADAIGKKHRTTQVADPIFRIHRLRVGHQGARAVGSQRNLRRSQGDCTQIRAKFLKYRLQHPAVRSDIDSDPLTIHISLRQPGFEAIQRRLRPRRHRQFGPVHSGQIQIITHERPKVLRGQPNRQHPASGHRVKQTPAQMHQTDAILKGHDPSQAGRGVLSHGMAGQCSRRDAPTDPQLRQGHFRDHDQRQLQRGLQQRCIRRSLRPALRQPKCANIVFLLFKNTHVRQRR